MNERDGRRNAKFIVILLVLIFLIILLIIGIIVIKKNNSSGEPADANAGLIDLADQMDDTSSDKVGFPLQALIFANNVSQKIATEDGYGLTQAQEEYKQIISTATGELKIYLALNYLKFLYEQNGDTETMNAVFEDVRSWMGEESIYYGLSWDTCDEVDDSIESACYNEMFAQNFSPEYWQTEMENEP